MVIVWHLDTTILPITTGTRGMNTKNTDTHIKNIPGNLRLSEIVPMLTTHIFRNDYYNIQKKKLLYLRSHVKKM